MVGWNKKSDEVKIFDTDQNILKLYVWKNSLLVWKGIIPSNINSYIIYDNEKLFYDDFEIPNQINFKEENNNFKNNSIYFYLLIILVIFILIFLYFKFWNF